MPIKSITLENFKGVKQRVEIPLRAITLLFGANSAGKSTILQALLYLRELLEHRQPDVDWLHASGKTIDLGGFQKMVHGRDTHQRVTVGVTVTVNDDGLGTYSRAPYSDDDDAEGIRIEDQLPLPLPGVHEVSVSVTVGWDNDFNHSHVHSFEVAINGEKVGEINEPLSDPEAKGIQRPLLKITESHPIFVGVFRPGTFDSAVNHIGDPIVGQLGYLGNPNYTVLGMLLPRSGQPLRLLENRNSDSTQLSTQDAEELFSHVMVGAMDEVLNELKRTRYIGPIRLVPDRAYSPVRTDLQHRWADGSAAWDLLHTMDDDLCWLNQKHFEQLGLGVKLDIHQYWEVVRSSPLGKALWNAHIPASKGLQGAALTSSEVRVDLKQKRRFQITSASSGMEIDPVDIGVGVSQAVPVVVGAMAPGYGLLAVEQPELHVHPAVQCRMADVLAHQVLGKERQLLLETHSEHLMLRLLRRVRETTDDELPPDAPRMTPADVSVIYLSNDEGELKVTVLPINAEGEFNRRWPKGFFEERVAEMF